VGLGRRGPRSAPLAGGVGRTGLLLGNDLWDFPYWRRSWRVFETCRRASPGHFVFRWPVTSRHSTTNGAGAALTLFRAKAVCWVLAQTMTQRGTWQLRLIGLREVAAADSRGGQKAVGRAVYLPWPTSWSGPSVQDCTGGFDRLCTRGPAVATSSDFRNFPTPCDSKGRRSRCTSESG